MRVRFRRVHPDRLAKMPVGLGGVVPVGQQDAEIQVRQPDIRIQAQRQPQMFLGLFSASKCISASPK